MKHSHSNELAKTLRIYSSVKQQKALDYLLECAATQWSTPVPSAYNRKWLATPNGMREDMAPIVLIMADTSKGVNQLRCLLSRENTLSSNCKTGAKQGHWQM